MFHAFDATTGKLLWEFKTSSGVEGPPSSFEIDGKQYIAVLTGWGADASGAGSTVARFFSVNRSRLSSWSARCTCSRLTKKVQVPKAKSQGLSKERG